MTPQQHPKLTITQDGKVYDLYNLPKGFVIRGNVDISNKRLTVLPDLSTVTIVGFFDCSCNNLTSLKGAPKEVNGSFYCGHNKLTSLKYGPKEVFGDFYCNYNKLTSLYGAPKEVNGNFYCNYNKLTSLYGAPKFVGKCFDCSHNNLAWLKGAPQTVWGNFDCSHNRLISLEGAPQEVGGGFNCSYNRLESLKGIPARCAFKTHAGFYDMTTPAVDFSYNRVSSLQYLPEIPHYLYWDCYNNPLKADITNVPDYVFECISHLRGVSFGSIEKELIFKHIQQRSR